MTPCQCGHDGVRLDHLADSVGQGHASAAAMVDSDHMIVTCETTHDEAPMKPVPSMTSTLTAFRIESPCRACIQTAHRPRAPLAHALGFPNPLEQSASQKSGSAIDP